MSHVRPPSSAHFAVSTVQSDRPCTGCDSNLLGEVIAREPHHRLLLARAPECGTVPPEQEYPRLDRGAMLVAALRFLALLIFTLATPGTMIGLSFATAEITSRPDARDLSQHYQQSKTVQSSDRRTTTHTCFDDDWWLRQDPDSVLASAAGGAASPTSAPCASGADPPSRSCSSAARGPCSSSRSAGGG